MTLFPWWASLVQTRTYRDRWLAGGAERKMGGREKETQTDSSVVADKQSGRQGLRKVTRKRLGSRV